MTTVRKPSTDPPLTAPNIQGSRACPGHELGKRREVQLPVVDIVPRGTGPREPLLGVLLPGLADIAGFPIPADNRSAPLLLARKNEGG